MALEHGHPDPCTWGRHSLDMLHADLSQIQGTSATSLLTITKRFNSKAWHLAGQTPLKEQSIPWLLVAIVVCIERGPALRGSN